jgi:hypothetical protein
MGISFAQKQAPAICRVGQGKRKGFLLARSTMGEYEQNTISPVEFQPTGSRFSTRADFSWPASQRLRSDEKIGGGTWGSYLVRGQKVK